MIKRDTNRVSKPLSNPASGLLEDTIDHYEISQSKAAEGMGVHKGMLNEVLKGKRGVSIDLALRAEAFMGVSASLLVRLQAQYDYEQAYHDKHSQYEKTIEPLECV